MKKAFTRLFLVFAVVFSSIAAFGQNYVDFGFGTDSYCEPANLTFYNYSSVAPVGTAQYKWKIDGVQVSTVDYPVATFPLMRGVHTLILEVYDSNDASLMGSSLYTVEIGGRTNNFNLSTGTQICVGQEVAVSVQNVWYNSWDFGYTSYFTSRYSDYQNASFTYDKAGTYNLKLIATNDCGTDTIVKVITVGAGAKPQVTATDVMVNAGCVNDPVSFSINGDYASYLWDFGDGKTSNLKSPNYTYKSNTLTSYAAKVTVTNSCGGSTTVNFPVNLGLSALPDASFDYSNSDGSGNCPGAPVTFTAFGSGTYFWDFGDGSTSTLRNPVHLFRSSGDYTVTLTVKNGCLLSNSFSRQVGVYGQESYVPYPYFDFEVNPDYSDTLHICPATTVNFINQTYGGPNISYIWDFGDGGTFYGLNSSHTYNTPGLYTVSLYAKDLCGMTNSSQKYIVVSSTTKPNTSLNLLPTTICAGDKVYFWDENFDARNNYSYSINFGDGQSVSNLKTNEDLNLQILKSHTYATTGVYSYIFTATSACGATVTNNGVITVDNNSARKPFYYIENSTEDQSYKTPEDWSVRHDASDYEITIPVSWPGWKATYGTKFQLFFYYGDFYGFYNGDPMYPSGVVNFTSADLTVAKQVKAYIPVNPLEALTVGIAATYYCSGTADYNLQPDAYGSMQQSGSDLYSIPIIPSGVTDLSSQGIEAIIDPYSYWDGVCNSSRPEGEWYKLVEPGVYARVSMYAGEGNSFDLAYADDPVYYSKYNNFISGYYYRNIDTIEMNNYNGCGDMGKYRIVRPDANTLQFVPVGTDLCTDRSNFLTGTFTRVVSNPGDYLAVCPGDKVQFNVVGGKSYVWNFGDGNTSTLSNPVHIYTNPGVYNVTVNATNGCGRVDVLTTKATIVPKKQTQFYWYPSNYNMMTGDSVHFTFEDNNYRAIENNTYLWNFGDGTTSTLKNPTHVYQVARDYKVSITVTNACGSTTQSEIYTVQNKLKLCDAQFDYGEDGGIYFSDQSAGTPTRWYWDFGDGEYSTDQYPYHVYARDGIYTVVLTIFNDQNNCQSSIAKKVTYGFVPCQSDFNFSINTGSGTTNFFSTSTGAEFYYWDFGDGKFSTAANPVHTYLKTGIYNVCLRIWNSTNACQSSICKKVVFIPADGSFVQADFSYIVNPDNFKVSFSGLSSTNVTNYYWTMGDGKVLKVKDPVYTYSKPGAYKVCLTVSDNLTSVANSVCKNVVVGTPPCNLGSMFTYFVDPSTKEVKFLNQSQGAVNSYFWTFGNGKSSARENPSIIFDKAGYYKVTLSVRNDESNCQDTYSAMVLVGDADCAAGFSTNINSDNNTVNFKDDSQGLIDYYYWDFGDGSFSVDPNPAHSYKKGGLYMVSQTVVSGAGICTDETRHAIQVGEINCSANFAYYIDSTELTAYFTNQVLGESTAMLWSFGDGSYSTDQNPEHEFPSAGIYSTGLNTYDVNTGCMDYYQENLLISSLGIDCSADFIYRVDPISSEVLFSNKSMGDIREVIWNFGDESENSTEFNPVHTYAKAGYYYVCLTVVNEAGIKNMGCKWVVVQANAAFDCHANFMFTIDTTLKKATFVNQSFGNIDNYYWDFGDSRPDSVSFETNPTHTYDSKGYYLVKLKAVNSATGCESNDYKLLNVADNMVLKAAFGYEAYDGNKKFTGYPVDLVSASSGDGATVEWDFGDKQIKKESFTIMDSTTKIVTHYYQIAGKYRVCLKVTDPVSGQSDEFCDFVSTKFGVSVKPGIPSSIELNVFPNPFVDYTNITYSLDKPQYIEMAIFDQLGRRVQTLEKSFKDSGRYEINWDSGILSTGVYHLKLISDEGTITRQMVITR
ncbi:MAG: PKD domain-containing protein [Bacteroidales bacterium]|nr:PKD domain-containing protein [Bacteroidales bacterium]